MENLIANPKRKMTLEEALAIREDYKAGMLWKEMSDKYGRSRVTLLDVIRGTHYLIRDMKEQTPGR